MMALQNPDRGKPAGDLDLIVDPHAEYDVIMKVEKIFKNTVVDRTLKP